MLEVKEKKQLAGWWEDSRLEASFVLFLPMTTFSEPKCRIDKNEVKIQALKTARTQRWLISKNSHFLVLLNFTQLFSGTCLCFFSFASIQRSRHPPPTPKAAVSLQVCPKQFTTSSLFCLIISKSVGSGIYAGLRRLEEDVNSSVVSTLWWRYLWIMNINAPPRFDSPFAVRGPPIFPIIPNDHLSPQFLCVIWKVSFLPPPCSLYLRVLCQVNHPPF